MYTSTFHELVTTPSAEKNAATVLSSKPRSFPEALREEKTSPTRFVSRPDRRNQARKVEFMLVCDLNWQRAPRVELTGDKMVSRQKRNEP